MYINLLAIVSSLRSLKIAVWKICDEKACVTRWYVSDRDSTKNLPIFQCWSVTIFIVDEANVNKGLSVCRATISSYMKGLDGTRKEIKYLKIKIRFYLEIGHLNRPKHPSPSLFFKKISRIYGSLSKRVITIRVGLF